MRDTFLAARRQNQPGFDRLDCALMLRDKDNSWRRASVNGETISYPASCVKLAYLVSAMHWCKEHNLLPAALDADISPMIRVSDNVATGRVIDTITSASNLPALKSANEPAFTDWLERRQYPSRIMARCGLLKNQVLLHKTYPSNSGVTPSGAESVAVNLFGGNRMQPNAAAMLMAQIVDGHIEPQATDYMRDLLHHPRWSGDSAIGFGLPPGTLYLNKVGLAFDTLEDIAYAKLPNGREFILAVFTDSYCGSETTQPYPYDGALLGIFAELLLTEIKLTDGCPPVVKVDNSSSHFHAGSNWAVGSAQAEAYSHDYIYAQGAATATTTATWDLQVPEDGIYEVCVWYPQSSNRVTDANYRVMHADGETRFELNQQQTGGRWVRLGDFRFTGHTGAVTLSNSSSDPAKVVCADAVKATKWPSAPPDWKPNVGEGNAALSKTTKFY